MDCFTRQEIADLLGIRTSRLCYWQRIGLIEPSISDKGRIYYSFQDLVCLRTTCGMVEKGVPAQKIKKSTASLRKRIDEPEAILTNKKVYVLGSRMILSQKERLINIQSGQLVLRFDVDELSRELRQKIHPLEERTAQAWFEEGRRCDSDPACHEQALQAYREALKLDPTLGEASLKMGTIYYNQGKLADAEHYYRLLIARDPYHARAYLLAGKSDRPVELLGGSHPPLREGSGDRSRFSRHLL